MLKGLTVPSRARVFCKKMLTADLELKYSLEIFVKTLNIAKKLNFNLF